MTKVSLLKKSTIVLMIAMVFACTLAAQEYDRAIIITGGYVPSQELSVNKNTTAITFELASNHFFYGTDFFTPGIGIGLDIRNYREIPNEWFVNSDDPHKNSATRFDLHLGPVLGIGNMERRAVYFVLSPQFGLWYAGMTSKGAGPNVSFTADLKLDMVLWHAATLGVTYRATKSRLTTTNWNMDNTLNNYIQIQHPIKGDACSVSNFRHATRQHCQRRYPNEKCYVPPSLTTRALSRTRGGEYCQNG